MNPQQRRPPIATLLLIAANVGVAYVTLLHPEFPIEYGFRPESPSLQNALESLFIHSTGQSGHIASRWYASFAERWASVDYITIPTKREAIEGPRVLRLLP